MSRPLRTISVTEAARGFADLVNRAFYRNETTVLMKNGVAVAHLAPAAPSGMPASELAERWAMMPHLTPEDAEDFGKLVAKARDAIPAPVNKWE